MTVYNGSLSTGPNAAASLDGSTGDYISSPSGTYAAFLSPDVRLTVSRGSTPSTAPSNVVWQTPLSNNISSKPSPLAQLLPPISSYPPDGGTLSLYDGNLPVTAPPVYVLGGNASGNSGVTLALADTGALTIKNGTPQNPGSQLFGNNVNDPVVGLSLSGISYNLANPIIKTSDNISGGTFRQTNNTSTAQTYPFSLALNYAKTSTWTWNLSEAITLGVKSSFDVGIPGLGETTSEISLSETTTISGGKGGSESESKTFTSGGNITVPAHSTYQTTLTATKETYDIPYTFDGIATYSSGATAEVQGTGDFNGGDTGVFIATTDCVSTPGGCGPGPVSEQLVGDTGSEVVVGGPAPVGAPLPVPEPASLPLLPAALIATAVIRRVRSARTKMLVKTEVL